MKSLKRVAAINDLSGSSRCSLTVALPVITAMGAQCCVLPTALLSNHTGYNEYYFEDYTNGMKEFSAMWKKQKLQFDCIYSGFLGSDKQIELVENFIADFKYDGTKIVIDPVMGDDGKIYTTYTEKMCLEMKKLISYADVVTPNITEACVLSDTPYVSENISMERALDICKKIYDKGAKNIILTGIKTEDTVSNYVYSGGDEGYVFTTPLTKTYYTGTGDLFSSVICGMFVNGCNIRDCALFATELTKKATEKSFELGLCWEDGICFELFMDELTRIVPAQAEKR